MDELTYTAFGEDFEIPLNSGITVRVGNEVLYLSAHDILESAKDANRPLLFTVV